MNVLALDLATVTGFAVELEGKRKSGYMNFAPHDRETPGWRYIRFNVWLYGWKERKLQLVITERAIPSMNNRFATEIAFGLSTRVEEFCARERLRLVTVNNSTLKKYFTGDGRAEKPEMIRFAQQVDPNVKDDNEADALLLLQYAKLVILKGSCERRT
jgi:hypothetical protein